MLFENFPPQKYLRSARKRVKSCWI